MLVPQTNVQTAPVDKLRFARPRILVGALLQDVKALQNSILRFGLLSPIVVRQHKGQLIVVDGRKRLAAIRRLRFTGQLPRSLVNIPYIELKDYRAVESPTPLLMSNRDLYTAVTTAFWEGNSESQIAEDLYLSHRCVRQILTLSRLSARLRGLFFERTISFEQARNYAAEPRHIIQNTVFNALGPFALAEDIQKTLQSASQKRPAAVTQMPASTMLYAA